MLVLSRKLGQQLVINFGGETAIIEIIKVVGSRVQIGIEAPTTVGVHRSEVWAKIVTETLGQYAEASTVDRVVA